VLRQSSLAGAQSRVGSDAKSSKIFDGGEISDVYCKASLIADLLAGRRQRRVVVKSVKAWDLIAARRLDGAAKYSKYFDRTAKTDVYYEAQLIAAEQADGSKPGAARSLKIHSR